MKQLNFIYRDSTDVKEGLIVTYNNIKFYNIEYSENVFDKSKSYFYIVSLFFPLIIYNESKSINIGKFNGKKYKTVEEAKFEVEKTFYKIISLFI